MPKNHDIGDTYAQELRAHASQIAAQMGGQFVDGNFDSFVSAEENGVWSTFSYECGVTATHAYDKEVA